MRVAGFRLRGRLGDTLEGDLAFRSDRVMAAARTAALVVDDGRPIAVRLGDVAARIVAVRTAATAAGTLVTLDLRVAHHPVRIPRVRRRLLRWGEDLLGIVAVTARDLQVVVAGVVADETGRVLAARRTRPAEHRGAWEFPGGKVEPGEQERPALVRELREELGIEVEVLEPLPAVLPLSDSAVLRTYRCRLVTGAPAPAGHDPAHDQVNWLEIGELDQVSWLPADRILLPLLRATLRA